MKSKVVSVRPGYKMTPLGEIPEDWKTEKISEYFEFVRSFQIPRDGLVLNDDDAGTFCIHYGDIHSFYKTNFLDFCAVDGVPKIAELGFKIKKTDYLRDGDIIMVDTSEDSAGIGKNLIVANLGNRSIIGGLHTIVLRRKDGVMDNIFGRYVFDHGLVKKELRRRATGTSVFSLSRRSLSDLFIVLPTTEEQSAIAKVLSTWDKAIDKTRQLIEQKELRKKALMQQLLTGKKRLKGFSGEWKEVRLGDLGTTFTGLSGKTKSDFGVGKPYVPYLNVFNNFVIDIEHLDYVKVSPLEDQNRLKYGDIIFTTSSETPSEVGMASVVLDHVGELYLNSFCFGFRLHDFEILVPQYSSWYFRSSKFRMMINKFAQGATRYNLSKTQMMHLKVTLPSIKEQIAIANLLGITDADLKIEKERLEKLKLQKKALMQVLLTGKKRLVK